MDYDDLSLWELADLQGYDAQDYGSRNYDYDYDRPRGIPESAPLDELLADLDVGHTASQSSRAYAGSQGSGHLSARSSHSYGGQEFPSPATPCSDYMRSPATPSLQARCSFGMDPMEDLLGELGAQLPSPSQLNFTRERPGRLGLRKEDPTPSPRRDTRGPVEDDYDVVASIEDYEQQHQSERPRRLERLEASRRQLHLQAEGLLNPSSSEATPLIIRLHYASVRDKLLAEARALEAQIAGDAAKFQPPDRGRSL